jgi:hypothetical protein
MSQRRRGRELNADTGDKRARSLVLQLGVPVTGEEDSTVTPDLPFSRSIMRSSESCNGVRRHRQTSPSAASTELNFIEYYCYIGYTHIAYDFPFDRPADQALWPAPMKNAVFWDVTPCGSCKSRRFGGT